MLSITMKTSSLIICCLIITHLAVYHITKLSYRIDAHLDSTRDTHELLLIIQNPKFNYSSETFKKKVFNEMLQYGWQITESETSYSLIFHEDYEWEISKDDLKTIKQIKPE